MASTSLRVQLREARVQVQPVPLIAVAVSPLGNVSVTVTVPLVEPVPLFVTVKTNCAPVCACVKLPVCVLVIDRSAARTSRDADAVFPVPPLPEVTLPVVLTFVPAVTPLTLTENTQELDDAIVAPDRITLPDPATAVMTPLPQEPVTPFGVSTTSPAGKVSLKATLVDDTVELGLSMVNVKLVVPLTERLAAPKAFAIDGGATTVTVAVLLVVPGPLSVDETGPEVSA